MESGAAEDLAMRRRGDQGSGSVLTGTQLPALLLSSSVPFPEARRETEVLNSGFAAESNPAQNGRKRKRQALPSSVPKASITKLTSYTPFIPLLDKPFSLILWIHFQPLCTYITYQKKFVEYIPWTREELQIIF